jgi:hypothetical protein
VTAIHSNITADRPATAGEGERTAIVEFERTWLAPPMDWALRIAGPSVGGYGVIDHLTRSIPTARYASKEAAQRVAAIWIETGLTPAYQTDERVAAFKGAR